MKAPYLCLLALSALSLTGCKQFLYGSNDVNFLGVPNKPRTTSPAYSNGSSYNGNTYSSGAPIYTPSYSSGPAPYSSVESQDQKMRNYGRQLDRQISRETW